jgi:CRISPR system Cascade subunit CasC
VRVSSQAWKRATRLGYASGLNTADLGVRTKQAVELLVTRMRDLSPDLDEVAASERAVAVLTALGIKTEKKTTKTRQKAIDAGDAAVVHPSTEYLIFWSNRQLERLAELAIDNPKPTKREVAAVGDTEHGIDVGLFGRMVADDADLNVDASVQVAHALSTHAAEIEQDYFTAVDDKNIGSNETGAGMIGTVEFNAATLYRYATVNVDLLRKNLAGDNEATARAVEAFVRGFVLSMPTGKQNTFANRTVPDGVIIAVRDDQPINLVGAFEEPVTLGDEVTSYVQGSAYRLVQQAHSVAEFAGSPREYVVAASTPRAADLSALGDLVTADELVSRVGHIVRGSQADG